MNLASSSRSATLYRARLRSSLPSIAHTSVRWSSDRAELSTEKSEADEDDEGKRGSNEITFQQWMDKSGHLFRDPLPGRPNWLGRVPFPMNPTFKPPTPMSDQRRNDIFATHIKNPEVWTVRKLSEHYNVAMKRIEAIIRLKSLEVKWKAENRPLRLNFQAGMESALGIKAGVNNHVASRLQLVQLGVDETSEDSSVPSSERGIHKIWWEDVKEGEEPIVGPRLVALAEEAAKKLADTQAATAEFAAAHSRVVEPTVEGRAPTVFVDVGTRFMNLKEEAKRQKASQARQRLKAKKRSRQTA